MKDTQLYGQLLGLSKPWSVERVELELEQSRITVHVRCEQGTVWGDPETGQDRALCALSVDALRPRRPAPASPAG
jgi:hypothetical protein